MIWDSERVRFLAVGAYNTLFGYVAFVLLYTWLQQAMHYLLIAVIAHFLAVTNAFFAHRIIVFRTRGPVRTAFFRYNVATLGILAGGLVCMALLVDFGGLHPLAAQAIIVLATVVVSYVAHKRYSFRQQL